MTAKTESPQSDAELPPEAMRDRRSRRPDAAALALHGCIVGAGLGALALDRWLARRVPRARRLASPIALAAHYSVMQRLERRRPFDPGWNDNRRDAKADLAFTLSAAAVAGLAEQVAEKLTAGCDNRLVRRLPMAAGVAVAWFAMDLPHYWIHRVGHEQGWGWKFHSVHHSVQRLASANAPRFQVGEAFVEVLSEYVVSGLLSLNPSQRVVFHTMRASYGQLQHSNIRMRCGWLNRVFSTPELHRWHHSQDYGEGDTNYGALVSVWDQLFGTYYAPDRPFLSPIGVGRMPDFPTEWRELQAVPRNWNAIRERNAATWYARDEEPVRGAISS